MVESAERILLHGIPGSGAACVAGEEYCVRFIDVYGGARNPESVPVYRLREVRNDGIAVLEHREVLPVEQIAKAVFESKSYKARERRERVEYIIYISKGGSRVEVEFNPSKPPALRRLLNVIGVKPEYITLNPFKLETYTETLKNIPGHIEVVERIVAPITVESRDNKVELWLSAYTEHIVAKEGQVFPGLRRVIENVLSGVSELVKYTGSRLLISRKSAILADDAIERIRMLSKVKYRTSIVLDVDHENKIVTVSQGVYVDDGVVLRRVLNEGSFYRLSVAGDVDGIYKSIDVIFSSYTSKVNSHLLEQAIGVGKIDAIDILERAAPEESNLLFTYGNGWEWRLLYTKNLSGVYEVKGMKIGILVDPLSMKAIPLLDERLVEPAANLPIDMKPIKVHNTGVVTYHIDSSHGTEGRPHINVTVTENIDGRVKFAVAVDALARTLRGILSYFNVLNIAQTIGGKVEHIKRAAKSTVLSVDGEKVDITVDETVEDKKKYVYLELKGLSLKANNYTVRLSIRINYAGMQPYRTLPAIMRHALGAANINPRLVLEFNKAITLMYLERFRSKVGYES